jgi:cystathionine beta-lyase
MTTTSTSTSFLDIDTLRGRRNMKWGRFPADVLPAWIADMDLGTAPAVQDAMRTLVERQDYGYPIRDGDRADLVVARAFAERMEARFGWCPDPDLAQPVADLVQAVFGAIMAYTEPGDGVVLHTPAYPPFFEAIGDTGRRLEANPLRDTGARYELDLDGLAAAAERSRLLLLCHPQNPTGRVFGADELTRIAAIAIEHDLVVVSDEIHADLVHDGRRFLPTALAAPEIADRTVTLTSATKSFNIPGLRTAVAHFGSAALRDRFLARLPRRLLGAVGSPGIDATVAAWRHGQPWLDDVLAKLAASRDRLTEHLERDLPEVGYHAPEATYLAWLDLAPLDLPETPQRFLLERARVGLNPGGDFGPEYDQFVRLNFATSPDILDEMVARIVPAVRAVRSART